MMHTESKDRRKKRILIADDDFDLLMALSIRLRKEGFEVITTADGYQAFTLTSTQRPDAVILDVNMPCGGGLGVHQKLRDNMLLLSIPIIYLTGNTSTRMYMLAAKMDAFAVITKPFATEELISTVREAVGMSKGDQSAITGETAGTMSTEAVPDEYSVRVGPSRGVSGVDNLIRG